MEFSQIFGFLKIFSESIKLILKNVRVIASITTLSLLLSSILFLLFSFFYQSAMAYISSLHIIIFTAFVFAVDFTFLFAYMAIARGLVMATVIATADTSNLSLQHLFGSVKTKWRSPLRNNFRRPRNPVHFLWIIAAAVVVLVVMHYPNPFTIAGASIIGFAIFVLYVYTSVVWSLASVILIVEDGCEAPEAMEKAEKLVEGQRLDGFMANLLFYILCLILVLSFWMIVGDQGRLNLTVYGLFFVSSGLVTMMFVSVMYTAYYLRCQINFLHTPLINDLP